MDTHRPRRFAHLLTAAALLLALGLSPCLALPRTSDRWIRVETPHFVLFGNAGKNRVVEIGQNLERLREVLTRTTKGMAVRSPLPTYVYVFRNEASFAPYKLDEQGRPESLAGYFVGAFDANYVAVDASAGDTPFAVIYHEYLHYFLNNNLPNLPQWLDEGFAEFYSTFRVRGDRAEIGRFVPTHLVTLNVDPLIPLAQLFEITVESEDYSGVRAGIFYAESWALTHYLIVGSEKGRSGMNRYINLLNHGEDSVEAFSAAFGFGLEQAENELRAYVKRDRLGYLPYDLDESPERQAWRLTRLERKELLFRLGELLSHTPPVRFEAAEGHYREALRLDETHAPSYVGLGRLSDLQGRYEEAAGLYEKAIALDPGDAAAYEHYGQSLLERHVQRSGGRLDPHGPAPEAVLKARKLLEKSIELDPESMTARAAFGKTFLYGDQDVSAGIAALTAAATALPARTDILYDLLLLHVRAGNRRAARAVLDDELRYRADDELLSHAESAVLSLDLAQADALVAAGQLDEAMAVLDRVAGETRDPELERQIRARLAALRDFHEAESVLGLYNRAMDRINAGNYEEALAILESLLPRIEDAELRAEGERHVSELREVTRHNRLVRRFNRAVGEANAGRLEAAARLLEQLLADEPDEELRKKAEAVLSGLGGRR